MKIFLPPINHFGCLLETVHEANTCVSRLFTVVYSFRAGYKEKTSNFNRCSGKRGLRILPSTQGPRTLRRTLRRTLKKTLSLRTLKRPLTRRTLERTLSLRTLKRTLITEDPKEDPYH